MPSEKVERILLARSDLSREELSELSEGEAWRLVYSLPKPAKRPTKPSVCFTGFGVTEKDELIELAERAGYKVVKSVTNRLSLLVYGENAGPAKCEKASQQGVELLTGAEFRKRLAGE